MRADATTATQDSRFNSASAYAFISAHLQRDERARHFAAESAHYDAMRPPSAQRHRTAHRRPLDVAPRIDHVPTARVYRRVSGVAPQTSSAAQDVAAHGQDCCERQRSAEESGAEPPTFLPKASSPPRRRPSASRDVAATRSRRMRSRGQPPRITRRATGVAFSYYFRRRMFDR